MWMKSKFDIPLGVEDSSLHASSFFGDVEDEVELDPKMTSIVNSALFRSGSVSVTETPVIDDESSSADPDAILSGSSRPTFNSLSTYFKKMIASEEVYNKLECISLKNAKARCRFLKQPLAAMGALSDEYDKLYASKQTIRKDALLVMAMLETTHMQSPVGYNLWGIKFFLPYGHSTFVPSMTTEYYDGVKTRVASLFLFSRDISEGVRHYEKFLSTKRYAPLKQHLKPGFLNFQDYIKTLGACGYYTSQNYLTVASSVYSKYKYLNLY